ncbi:MAG: BLUF domain-containing protein [Pedobacter sp.]
MIFYYLSTMFYDLIYFSHSTGTIHIKEMNLILAKSRFRNADQGVTGFLVYVEGIFDDHTEGRFLQVLEGSKKDVTEIYDSIKKDPRHHQVTTIKEGPLEIRNFNCWRMGYESFNVQEFPDLQFFFQLDIQPLIYHDDHHPMLDFIKSFAVTGKNIR